MIKRWFGRGRDRGNGSGQAPPPDDGLPDGGDRPSELDLLLATTVARHFAQSTVDGRVVRLGFGNVEIECRVDHTEHTGKQWSAALFLHLSGGALGARPMFASINGYHHDGPGQAVIEGGCLWSCSFGPVLVAGLTGVDDPEVTRQDLTIRGRRWQLVHGRLDRWMSSQDGAALAAGIRHRLGGRPQLTPAVLPAVPADLLTSRRANLLGVFVMEGCGRRTVEIKVNGVDTPVAWPPATVPPSDADGFVMLRELALLLPVDAPVRSMPLPDVLDAAGLERLLAHLSRLDAPGQFAGWRGWRTHGGRPAPTLTGEELAGVEASTGPLPADYRRFLTEVSGPGAGPGYGLLAPRRVGDVVPLAQAGCNAVWVLRVGDDDHGSVWVDSTPLDDRTHRVADSFTDWYRDWLDGALQGEGAWTHWNPTSCPTNGLLTQLVERHGEDSPRTPEGLPDLSGALTRSVIMGWNAYLPPPADGHYQVDHCQGCAVNLARFGVPEDVVEPGALSRR